MTDTGPAGARPRVTLEDLLKDEMLQQENHLDHIRVLCTKVDASRDRVKKIIESLLERNGGR